MQLIKKLFLFIFLIIIILLALGVWVGKKYGPEIQRIVIKEANKSLTGKIDVEDLEFSFIRNFPHASIAFKNICIYSSLNMADTLLFAENLSAKFSLKDLYYGNYSITGIQINNGFANIQYNEQGKANYNIWQSSDSAGSDLDFSLKNINLSQLAFNLQNKKNKLTIDLTIDEVLASLSYAGNQTKVELNGELKGALVLADNKQVLNQAIFNLNTLFTVDENEINFTDSKIGLQNVDLQLRGNINYEKQTAFNLNLSSNSSSFEALLSLFPGTNKALDDYQISGYSKIHAKLTGSWTANTYPLIEANFIVSEAQLKAKEILYPVKIATANGLFTNGKNKNNSSSSLSLSALSLYWGQSKFEGKALIANFNHPQLKIKGQSFIQLEEVSQLDSSGNYFYSGIAKGPIQLEINLNEWRKPELKDLESSFFEGEIELSDFKLNSNNTTLSDWNGNFYAKKEELEIINLKGKINQQQLELSGNIYNYFSNLVLNKGTLVADLNITTDILNVQELIGAKQNESEKTQQYANQQIFIDLNSSSLIWDKLHFDKVHSSIFIRDQRIEINEFAANAFGGKLNLQLVYANRFNQVFNGKIDFENIAIDQLFSSLNNFEQDLIRSENIAGKATGSSYYNFELNSNNQLQLKSIQVDADLKIENGRLKDVKSLNSLSKYIELEELKDIKFKTLQNQISIKDCTIVIPKFLIENSALSITLEGEHHFNQNIDYYIELYLNDVLGKKVRKPQNNEFGYVEDDGLGRSKLFLKMSGTSSNPVFSYNKTGLKDHLKEKIAIEKESLKSLLNKEFGFFKKDSTIQQSKESSSKKASPFQIEWEGNTDSTRNSRTEKPKKKANKKSKLGKFIDKIAQPNEEEFVDPEDY